MLGPKHQLVEDVIRRIAEAMGVLAEFHSTAIASTFAGSIQPEL